MTHVYLELQVVSDALYLAKTDRREKADKSARGGQHGALSGHDSYKKIRKVMEHCEYMYWRWKRNGKFKFDADEIKRAYAVPWVDDFQSFASDLRKMWTTYQDACRPYRLALQNSIDDSLWYKAR